MRSVLFAISETAIIDGRSNLLTLINFIEQYNIASFPSVLPPMTLLVWAEKEDGDPETDTLNTIWRLDKEKVAEVAVDIDYQDASKARTILEINGLIVERPGILEVQLRRGRKTLGSWSININKTGKPEISTGEGKKSSKTSKDPKKASKKR